MKPKKLKNKTNIQEHSLNRAGYFPLGAVLDSESAQKAFEAEIQAARDYPRLPGKEDTQGKTLTLSHMRDTLLRLHTLEEYGDVPDDRKNDNHRVIQLGLGRVVSCYPLPLTESRVAIVTTFRPIFNKFRPTESVDEVITRVMLWDEYLQEG